MLYEVVYFPARQLHMELLQIIASIIFFEDFGFPVLNKNKLEIIF